MMQQGCKLSIEAGRGNEQQLWAMSCQPGVQIKNAPKGGLVEGWILSSDLDAHAVSQVKDQYGERGVIVHAKPIRGVLTKNKGGREYVAREKVRLSLYLPDPHSEPYFFQDDWCMATQHIPCPDEELKEAIQKSYFLSVEPDGRLEHRSRMIGNGSTFYSISDVVRAFPAMRDFMFSFFPGAPEYPTYTVRGYQGRYITTTDLRRLASRNSVPLPDGDDRDIFGEAHRVTVRLRDGSLQKVHMKNADSSICISVTWLEKSQLSHLSKFLAPGHPGVPIILGQHPPNRGAKMKGKDEPNVETTVKCGLKGKLADPKAREILEAFVIKVSKSARFMSLLLSVVVAKTLEGNSGQFPEGFSILCDDKHIERNVEHALRRAHSESKAMAADGSNPSYTPFVKAIDQVLDDHQDVFKPLQCNIPSGGNMFVNEAKSYITCLLTSIQKAGPGRIAALLSSMANLEGVSHKKLVYPTVQFIERKCDNLPAHLPISMAQIAEKYRKLYSDTGLHDKHGFRVHKIIDARKRCARVNTILELFFEINEDHSRVSARAADLGWEVITPDSEQYFTAEELQDLHAIMDEQHQQDAACATQPVSGAQDDKKKVWRSGAFALLPVNAMRRRHIRIDKDVFTRIIFKELHQMNVEGVQEDAFLSLFKGTKKTSSLQLRGKKQGFVIGRSFTTDGTAVCVPFFNSLRHKRRVEARQEALGDAPIQIGFEDIAACQKQPDVSATSGDAHAFEILDTDIVVGGDPGRNVMAQFAIPQAQGRVDPTAGNFKIMGLSRDQLYESSGMNKTAASRDRRVRHHATQALAALSSTRRRTHRSGELLAYIRCCGQHASALDRAYLSRNASGERFANYRGKHSVVDRHLTELQSQCKAVASDARIVIAMGDASFSSSGRGERSVPTTWFSKRIARCYPNMKLTSVSEHNTTQKCCKCHQQLLKVRRRHTCRDGSVRLVTDRDVRVCSSNQCLRSHPCPAEEGQLKDTMLQEDLAQGVVVCRDGNSAVSHHCLAGLSEHQRPDAFKLKSTTLLR